MQAVVLCRPVFSRLRLAVNWIKFLSVLGLRLQLVSWLLVLAIFAASLLSVLLHVISVCLSPTPAHSSNESSPSPTWISPAFSSATSLRSKPKKAVCSKGFYEQILTYLNILGQHSKYSVFSLNYVFKIFAM